MRARVARAVFVPNYEYVCLSCRTQSVGAERGGTRRYQHSNSKGDDGLSHGNKASPEEPENADAPVASSRIREIIRGFMGGQKPKNHGQETVSLQPTVQNGQKPSIPRNAPTSNDDARQQKLQQQFAEQRRKDLLEMQAGNIRKIEATREGVIDKIVPKRKEKKERQAHYRTRIARRRQKGEMAKRRPDDSTIPALANAIEVVTATLGQADDQPTTSVPEPESPTDKEVGRIAQETERNNTESVEPEMEETKAEEKKAIADPSHDASVSVNDTGDSTEKSQTTSKKLKPKVRLKNSGSKKSAPKSDKKPTTEVKAKAPTEAERKAQLANRIEAEGKKTKVTFRKCDTMPALVSKHAVDDMRSPALRKALSKKRGSVTKISDVEDFDSIKSAIGGNATKAKTNIEKADATKLEILPVAVDQPPVPSLSYGLERVLFNPGVYQLQDPRSRVYNFDPYLQKIMPVAEFDFNALKEYITSSRDTSLKRIAKEHNKRYVGSTSSMTGVLAHFHFLLSQWRPINATMLSKTFPTHLTSFTELQRAPSAIFLRWKDGSYAIDADKQFQNASVLSMLGKSMEKLLTLETEHFERYRKSSLGEVTEDEQFAPESYHYSTMGDFLMRSQLDAYDPRLPGTGMFDLKTRAVVSIRMDVSNYEQGTGYQIKSRQGEWESYEREYYDMIRAAFLKYSMQVRMGRMDGIFVAFHNVERIFGFQYISLPEMDSTIHGQWDTSIGDQEFKLSLDLLNKALDKATAKFPETSIRLHFETREAQTPFMYIFAEPVTEEQVAEIQNANDAKIQEFERSILGLTRGNEDESGETREDDGKWENIQADVQKEMDKDELSLDDPSEDQGVDEVEEVDMEDNGRISEIQGIFEEGLLYANKGSPEAEGDATAAATAGSQDDEDEGENDIAEYQDIAEADKDSSQREPDEIRETDHEVEVANEGGDDDRLEAAEIASNTQEESSVEVITDESSNESQASEQDTILSREDSIEPTSDAERSFENESEDSSPRDATNSGGGKEPEAKTLSPKEQKKRAKADYVPQVGEEQSAFQTEADQPFLDAIDQEIPNIDEAVEDKPDILAMTLTLRNRVNGQYTLRPEQLTDKDKWSIEYTLNEVPTQRKARALYEACQMRRMKKMDKPLVAEDAETINFYIQNLRKMSRKGRDWREEQNKKDSEKPVQVVGQKLAKAEEENV